MFILRFVKFYERLLSIIERKTICMKTKAYYCNSMHHIMLCLAIDNQVRNSKYEGNGKKNKRNIYGRINL